MIEQMNNAIDLVNRKFYGKTDKVRENYIYHLHKVATMSFNVAMNVAYYEEIDDEFFAMKCFITGLLHDIIEDTDITNDELSIFDDDIITAVKLLTHLKGVSYKEYFDAIVNSDNKIAIIVKYCDACHNGDVMRYAVENRTRKVRHRCKTYRKRANILSKKIIEWIHHENLS